MPLRLPAPNCRDLATAPLAAKAVVVLVVLTAMMVIEMAVMVVVGLVVVMAVMVLMLMVVGRSHTALKPTWRPLPMPFLRHRI